MLERFAGALLALFYLSGRFSLAGNERGATQETLLFDVRVWSLAALAGIAFVYSPPRTRQLRPAQYLSARLVSAMSILLPIYVATSFLWTLDADTSTTKALEASILAAVCICVIPFFKVGRAPVVRHWFWIALVVVTGLMCLLGCFVLDTTRLSVLGGGPNTFGRNMGLLFLGLLYFQRRDRAANGWRWYPLMALAIVSVVLSGSRGALLATSIGGLVYFLIDDRYRTRNVAAIGCFVVLLQIGLLTTEIGQRAYEMFEKRVVMLTLERQHMSGREQLFPAALELGLESPWFGQGLSGFTIVVGHNYPHNIALELFCETGVVGVMLLTLLVCGALSFVRRHRRYCNPVIWGAFGLMLSSAMFSGDFYDSRGIVLMAMLGSQEIVVRRGVGSKTPARRAGIVRLHGGSYSPSLTARS